jgi:hypothetical protein
MPLSMPNSRWPTRVHDISDEDRKTYRKWTRASYACYTLLVAGLIAVGLLTRQSERQIAAEDQTVGMGAITKPAGRHHPGG